MASPPALTKMRLRFEALNRSGPGSVKVGTILVKPWSGNAAHRGLTRVLQTEAIWNGLGFPSLGLDRIKKNLEGVPRKARKGLVVGCNIGPHPANLRQANPEDYLTTARDELLQLVAALHEHADFFVVNLSSPNTPGLRKLLQSGNLAQRLFHPLREAIRQCDSRSSRRRQTPLLVKLAPEDADRIPWTCESLKAIVEPLVGSDACDGFVAVNTSSRLASEYGEESGGVSGTPLQPLALQVVKDLRRLIGPERLIIGSGGIISPEDATEFITVGSNLVEIYSGLVYRGPGLISRCSGRAARPEIPVRARVFVTRPAALDDLPP